MIRQKKVICVLLLVHFVFLIGCSPNLSFLEKKEQALYPTTSDFPNTKWICRELDMFFYMFEHGECMMIGTYKVDSLSYRVLARFEFDELNITFYSSTDVSTSKDSNSMVHCEPISCGFIYSDYFFDKDTETIVCSVRNSMSVDGETIPKELTFEKVGTIELNQNVRWYAQELDMYLDSFLDVEGYYSGEIMLEGIKHYVHALEIGNNGYFLLSIENGKLNKLTVGTTSPLIYMYFKAENNLITATVCDSYLSNTEAFPYWSYKDSVITFKPVSFEGQK